MKRRHLAVWISALATLSTPVWADVSAADRNAAQMLFDQGKQLMEAGNYTAACPKLAQSLKLDPAGGTMINLALCHEKEGKSATAWADFKEALGSARRDGRPDRERAAQEHVQALEPQLARLMVSIAGNDEHEEVKLDGSMLSRAAWGTFAPIDPGAHEIVASSPGKLAWRGRIEIARSEQKSIAVPVLGTDTAAAVSASATAPASLGETKARGDAPIASPATPASSPFSDTGSRSSTQRMLGWAATGVGVVGLGLGIVFEVKRSSKVSERDGVCPTHEDCAIGSQVRIDQMTEDARSASTTGTVTLVAGGLLAAGGLALVLTAPKTQTVSFSPVVSPTFQGVMVSGHAW